MSVWPIDERRLPMCYTFHLLHNSDSGEQTYHDACIHCQAVSTGATKSKPHS